MRIRSSFSSVVCVLALLLAVVKQGAADSLPIEINFTGRYVVPLFDVIDEGVQICRKNGAESVAYDPKTKRLFVTNRTNLVVEAGQLPQSATTVPSVDVLDISDPSNPTLEFQIDATGLCDDNDPDTEPEPTSVAADRGRVAVALKLVVRDDDGNDIDETAPGCVAFFDADGTFLNEVTVGSLPDMVTFTPDGRYVLTADEGEANEAYTKDPEGTVSIIDVRDGVDRAVVRTARFGRFNSRRDQLRKADVRIFGPPSPPEDPVDPDGATVAQDVEPEYISVTHDSRTAYVTLQENNALAMVDIRRAKVTRILPLGFKDHLQPGNELDASNKDDAINLANWPVFGMYQPDAIASFRTRGRTYVVTANEGDSRDKDGFSEEERVKGVNLNEDRFPNASELQSDGNLGRLKITTELGDIDGSAKDDFEELYAFGTRSFSIWNRNGRLVFDSGSDFARLIERELPSDAFNTADDKTEFDDRSDDKGVEPEGVTVAKIEVRWYAFTILERTGGIVAYDVSYPKKARLIDYANSRNFAQDAEVDDFFPDGYRFPVGLDENDFSKCNPGIEGPGDSAPEVILYVSEEDSPVDAPLLVVAHETTSSTAIYTIEADDGDDDDDDDDDDDS